MIDDFKQFAISVVAMSPKPVGNTFIFKSGIDINVLQEIAKVVQRVFVELEGYLCLEFAGNYYKIPKDVVDKTFIEHLVHD